jgi:hypothetical protein
LPSSQILLKSVLFATDFSAASMRALPYASDTATQYEARLYVAHVVPIESYLLGDSQAVERLRLARQGGIEFGRHCAVPVRSPHFRNAITRQRRCMGGAERVYRAVLGGSVGRWHDWAHRARKSFCLGRSQKRLFVNRLVRSWLWGPRTPDEAVTRVQKILTK